MPESGNCASIINMRYQDGGVGSPSNPDKFKNQDYAQLKDSYVRRQRLFVDNTFPPNNQSLGDLADLSYRQELEVEWLRPADILKAQNVTDDPTFCIKGATRFDFGQGSVGNCWFLAALSSLTLQKGLFVQVVPMDQTFEDYAGIFHFRFWRFGKWVDVVIDDYLPTRYKQLLSVYSKTQNEFWVPLLEKAYAKVCGSYADMSTGLPSEACKDFSGGLNMTYELQDVHTTGHDLKLWSSLTRATGCKSMICCGTAQKGGVLVNTVADNGIVDAHAYSITGTTEIMLYGSKVRLVRLLNPWGKKEWNGKWSDKSDMWNRVSPEDREKCFDRDDGEFWMELEDFCHHYKMMSICCETPNFIDGDFTCQWKSMTYDGSWIAGSSAGGSLSTSVGSFATNPQFRMEVTVIDMEEKADENIAISLMQKPQQQKRKKIQSYPIGLSIFKIPAGTPAGTLRSTFFRRNRPMKHIQSYTYARDLIELHSLKPGEYVIIPSTMEPYMTADFVLTVYSKTETKISPHDGDETADGEEEKLILPKPPGNNIEKDDEEDMEDNEAATQGNPIRTMFSRYADQHGELKARQLQKLLNDNFPHGTWNGFGLDTCRSMITMVDVDQRMTMTFTEFSTLWEKINKYQKQFHRADVNQVGSLTGDQLNEAIEAAGMDMDDIMVRMATFRYSDQSSISIESFITLMLRLEKVSNVFNDKSTDGVIHMSWREWSNFTIYN